MESQSNSIKQERSFVRHDTPTTDPQDSEHWQSLHHEAKDRLLQNLEDLKTAFREDIANQSHQSLALWSAICGYCEALTTHKDPLKRFRIYPIPFDALKRLVSLEFIPFCEQLKAQLEEKQKQCLAGETTNATRKHREAVRLVSNAVWKRAESKSKNVRDELHANSLYVCFRGRIDKRSLDCFGSAVVTIAALHNVLEGAHSYSFLTLSEDHAYESHYLHNESGTPMVVGDEGATTLAPSEYGTCEIAVPGNTKDVQQTRGLEVADALRKASKHREDAADVTPESSWLYMRKHPVICHNILMAVAAVIANVNCCIAEQNNVGGNNSVHPSRQLLSGPLIDMKRELLWILNDQGHLSRFPFALMELGECEEHRTTSKGLEWVDVTEMGIPEKVTGMEKLYLDAMAIARNIYGDAQTYPYFVAGHYHKDGIWEEVQVQNEDCVDECTNTTNSSGMTRCRFVPGEEYRLVESIRLYSEATRVASQYRYDLQLMKHTTKAAMLIMTDILSTNGGQSPREWHQESNAIAAATWLLAFYDSLLLWEESCGGKQFCVIVTPKHKYSMGKMFQLFQLNVRLKMIDRVYNNSVDEDEPKCDVSKDDDKTKRRAGPVITQKNLVFFSRPRSRRLQKDSPLMKALGKEKVTIGEMELTIPMSSEGGRRAKRARR